MNNLQATKTKNAWAFYDWANSVYPLVITTAIFPIFFNSVTENVGRKTTEIINGESVIQYHVGFHGFEFINTELYSYVAAASFLVVIFLSPILSGIADFKGSKKNFLQFFCYLGAAACASLFFFDASSLELSMLSPFFASIGFWGSIVFYNSYLPEIAPPEEHDKLSAKGFSLGYTGSVILLVINLIMIQKHEWFGFESEALPTKLSFLMVAIWWAGFAQITFNRLPKNKARNTSEKHVWKKGFAELNAVMKQANKIIRLKRFLLGFFVYSMAVQTIMLMAQFFGIKEVYRIGENGEKIQGLETGELIIAIILVQVIAIPGAYLFSFISSKIGNILTIISALITWIIICVSAYLFVHTPISFYIAAGSIGFVMGGTQAISRSTYSKLLPETKDTTSFFSFYDVLEKAGIVIGMFSFGLIEGITGSMRASILSLILFFIVGMIIIFTIPGKKEELNKPAIA